MNLPMPDLSHLVRMTDDTGLFEHACGAVPRAAHGYCSDDAGRALALNCTFTVTGQPDWADVTIQSAEWFIGRNDLGVAMVDERTGGCFDGLQVDGPNANQGAESTIAFLTALRQAREVALPSDQACVA